MQTYRTRTDRRWTCKCVPGQINGVKPIYYSTGEEVGFRLSTRGEFMGEYREIVRDYEYVRRNKRHRRQEGT